MSLRLFGADNARVLFIYLISISVLPNPMSNEPWTFAKFSYFQVFGNAFLKSTNKSQQFGYDASIVNTGQLAASRLDRPRVL